MKNARVVVLACCAALVMLAACAPSAGQPEPAVEPETTVEAPEEVLAARDALLDFMYEASTICVPPQGVTWQAEEAGSEIPEGFAAYYFTAEECVITVTYVDEPTVPRYHVDLNNATTGCCWQAQVDTEGHIVKTGDHAGADPDPGNPAAEYCTGQGYEYEVRINPETNCVCSACIFPDGSTCQAWEYFRGQCEPGTNLADSDT